MNTAATKTIQCIKVLNAHENNKVTNLKDFDYNNNLFFFFIHKLGNLKVLVCFKKSLEAIIVCLLMLKSRTLKLLMKNQAHSINMFFLLIIMIIN